MPAHVSEMKIMNRNVERNVTLEEVANAIWEGKAIMGTDGSVRDPTATYSFVISISRTDVQTNVRGGRFLPPTANQVFGPILETSRSCSSTCGAYMDTETPSKFPESH